MAKLSADASDLLQEMRNAIEDVHGDKLDRTWDPLVEMAVYAADPALPPAMRFHANREIAQYVYAKRKAVEHSGEVGSRRVLLVQFSPGKGITIDAELGNDDTAADPHPQALDAPQQPQAAAGGRDARGAEHGDLVHQ